MSNPPDLTLASLTENVRAAREESPAAATASSTEALVEATGEGAPGAPGAPPAPAFMPRPEWCDFWLKCHGIAGHTIGSKVLAGVPERAGGTEAAGAIYDTCADTPALHWVIAPGGKWFQRIAVVGHFYAPIVGEVRLERARRQAPPAPRPTESATEIGGLAMPPNGAV